MIPPVYILATCRNPDLLRATTFVFASLRNGFPTADVTVHLNGMSGSIAETVFQAATGAECRVVAVPHTIHHEWVAGLLESQREPFIILDTDVVFWQSVEGFDYSDCALSGRLAPEFYDLFTRCVTRPRLHGSFLYLDPARIREQVSRFKAGFPDTPFNPMANLIYPLMVPGRPHSFFHDTCCLLYQAIGGQAFTPEQLDCYDHLNCGTIADLVEPHGHVGMVERQKAIYADPSRVRGIWRQQNEYYDHYRTVPAAA